MIYGVISASMRARAEHGRLMGMRPAEVSVGRFFALLKGDDAMDETKCQWRELFSTKIHGERTVRRLLKEMGDSLALAALAPDDLPARLIGTHGTLPLLVQGASLHYTPLYYHEPETDAVWSVTRPGRPQRHFLCPTVRTCHSGEVVPLGVTHFLVCYFGSYGEHDAPDEPLFAGPSSTTRSPFTEPIEYEVTFYGKGGSSLFGFASAGGLSVRFARALSSDCALPCLTRRRVVAS